MGSWHAVFERVCCCEEVWSLPRDGGVWVGYLLLLPFFRVSGEVEFLYSLLIIKQYFFPLFKYQPRGMVRLGDFFWEVLFAMSSVGKL